MLQYVKDFLAKNNLADKKILIGLSGGCDSTVLADILSKTVVEPKNIIAIHLNHNWRGEESKRDEEFARKFSIKRNLGFYSEMLSKDIKKTETDAREARYDFFARAKEKLNADAVFLAHNKNDNVETLIYRLVKGTGCKGMNSIPIIRDFYFRPLLNFSREEIEKYAKENGVEYIKDSSNSDTKYKRNLIRNEILPLMKEINPNIINAVSNFIKINKMNQKIVDEAILNTENKITRDGAILRDEFLLLPDYIQYELINRKFTGVLKNRDFKNTKKIIDFIKNNTSSKLSLNSELLLKVYDNRIYILKQTSKKGVTAPAPVESASSVPAPADTTALVPPAPSGTRAIAPDSIGSSTSASALDSAPAAPDTPAAPETIAIPCQAHTLLKAGENRFLNYTILVEPANTPDFFPNNNENIQYVNLDFKNKYILRTRKQGDIIQTFNTNTPQKLKTFFIKKKIPSELRDKIPLITLKNEVLFIPNIMTSEKLRVEKNDKNCYKITIKRSTLKNGIKNAD